MKKRKRSPGPRARGKAKKGGFLAVGWLWRLKGGDDNATGNDFLDLLTCLDFPGLVDRPFIFSV